MSSSYRSVILIFFIFYFRGIYGQEIANKQCEKYVNDFEKIKSSQRVKRVIGGTPASPSEFPFMAALGFGDDKNIKWLCGGSLISEKFVLTAAQCTVSRDFGNANTIRLGTTKLTTSIGEHPAQDIAVKKIHIHPEYVNRIRYNDIALIELAKEVNFSSSVYPACLHSESKSIDVPVVATGWGLTQFAGNRSDDLLKVTLSIISSDDCKKAYPSTSSGLSKGIQADSQLCARSADNTPRDTCQGDSGGPLVIQKEAKSIIAGVTSFGKACGIARSPGVYTRVSAFVPWLESVVWKK
ncbi:hypothetical protein WA026_000316 [Henosepilachna vigintioctopunctata]|uniref:Peptidase S1 domain-containing protein n=1 Tax=Henosepilachna vigintioctopunctata TaxID=420089 RepID=A0AAW1V4S4_9CUCU